MKKLLIVLLVLGMTSLASAATVSLTGEGTIINAASGTTVRVTISTDAGLLALDALISVAGGDVISGAIGVVDAATFGWDAGFSFDPTGLGTAAVEIGLGTFSGATGPVVGYVDVAYTGGTQIVSIVGATGFGGSADLGFAVPAFSSGVVTIVPEPATIALLGFGALALLRRRRK